MPAPSRRVLLTFDTPVLVTVNLDSATVEQVQVGKDNAILDASKGIVTADEDLKEVPADEAQQALQIAEEKPWPIGIYF